MGAGEHAGAVIEGNDFATRADFCGEVFEVNAVAASEVEDRLVGLEVQGFNGELLEAGFAAQANGPTNEGVKTRVAAGAVVNAATGCEIEGHAT